MIQVHRHHSKEAMFDACKVHCMHFLNVNNIPQLPVYSKYTKYRGYYMPYENPYIVVNLDNCLTPRYNPTQRNQSFPNHKTDSTPIGVLAHEFGHAVDFYYRTKGIRLDHQFKAIQKLEPQVTSYDTTPLERVAEAMRLFILNPQLLKFGRPMAYNILIQYLTPTVLQPWNKAYELIGHNEEKYIHWATQWIKRGNKQLALNY